MLPILCHEICSEIFFNARFFEKKKGGGENAPKKALTLRLLIKFLYNNVFSDN